MALTTHLHLAPRLKKDCNYNFTPPFGLLWPVLGWPLTFTFTYIRCSFLNHVIWIVAMVVDRNFSNVVNPKLCYVAEEGDGVVYRSQVCLCSRTALSLPHLRTWSLGTKLLAFTYALTIFGQNNSAFFRLRVNNCFPFLLVLKWTRENVVIVRSEPDGTRWRTVEGKWRGKMRMEWVPAASQTKPAIFLNSSHLGFKWTFCLLNRSTLDIVVLCYIGIF